MSIHIKQTNGTPTEIVLDGNVLPLYTYEQVCMDNKKARLYATTLRAKIGGFANHVPPLPLSGPIDATIMWLLLTQCTICSYAGFDLTPQSFGAPHGYGRLEREQWDNGTAPSMQQHHEYVPGPRDIYPAYALETPFAIGEAVVKKAPYRRPLAIAPGM